MARDEIGSSQFHYRTHGSLRHAIQLVHVRRTGGRAGAIATEKISEFPKEKLTRIVTVQRAHDARGG
eukprot:1946743-Pleurochrysis_carterae.AAC.2